ncbi:PQQ-binding-like beta-propeller repeat protein [Haladaptatus sp. DFWS20]|uniref:outer membrane protein assembly factor BamB family protein n=1 Tax=Haladaptatus sp. DFWS20 TaxID=3403467 RepID=UPI003EBE2717
MSEKSHTWNYRNRRTFLKSVGATMGAVGYGSTTSGARNEDSDDDDEREDWWPGPRSGPARTGSTDESGPMPYAALDWQMDLDGSMYNVEPIVADETVYLAVTTDNSAAENDGYIGAYDLETGDELWQRADLPAPKTPGLSDEMIYFASQVLESSDSDEGGFYALDMETGQTMWTRKDHDVWSPPVISNGIVYSSNRDGTFAFDRENGDTVWKADGIDGLADDVGDALTYADETVFTSNGRALDADNGSTMWRVPPENGTLGNPTVHDEMVYYTRTEYIVGDDDRISVEARSADTGAVEWSYDSGNNRWDGRLSVTDGRVILLDSTPEETSVMALDADTGTEDWTAEVEGTFFSSPSVGDGTVYIGGQYAPDSTSSAGQALVHAIDGATGDKKWSYLLDGSDLETSPEDPPAAGTPVVADGKLVATTYPAGSTLDYGYVYYSNLFVLESCDERPDADNRLPTDDESDDQCAHPKPEACIEATPNPDSDDIDAGDTIRFDASCSTGCELQFEWNTDGDGQFEETGSSVCVTVPTCGSLTVELEVTDANDDTDTASVSVSAN